MRQVIARIARQAFASARTTLAIAVAATTLAVAPAHANPKYAAIVIDANTGKTLFSSRGDDRRFPASLTKMMTLYLTFEALEARRISKTTPVPFSKNAANEPPTKLGVRAGGSITVETAILSLVTKSANDASTALAELLGGSEAEFARRMTAKAKQLGMSNTVFRNANGLPNPQQHTTARDMATLGIALREHFPQHYDYFSTRSFKFGKQTLSNHNRLLGRVKGTDGIKTGYTRASGFNLVSSVSDGNRRIVAVVMGGRSARTRDDHMVELINTWLPRATPRRGGGNLVAKAASGGSSPIQALSALLPTRNAPTPKPAPRPEEEIVAYADTQDGDDFDSMEGEGSAEPNLPFEYSEPDPARMGDIDPVRTASVAVPGWAVQVASSLSEGEARSFLTQTASRAGEIVGSASPFTVTFENGGVTYYRARFGGYESKSAAWKACDALKRKRIDCYAVQQ